MKDYINWCINQHDVVCNQKYDGNLPYSFHVKQVVREVKRFKHILEPIDYFLALHGAWGHDLIEDCRITYNDVVQLPFKSSLHFQRMGEVKSYPGFWKEVADVIYSVTDEKGRNRDERHSDKYYQELKENKIGVFVKICDIIANSKYSKFSESSMLKRYQGDFPKVKKQLYMSEYKEMFDYLETVLEL